MREDAQLREFLVEIARGTRIAIANGQYFGDNIVLLPSASPCVAGRCDRQFGVQFQITYINSLVTGQGGVAWPSFQTQPALILEADLLQLLSALDGQIVQPFCQYLFGLVQRSVAILICNWNECSVVDQFFGYRLVAPEACIMEGRVSMLVRGVYIRFVPEQLWKSEGKPR